MQNSQLLSRREAATQLGVSVDTVRRLIATGELACIRICGRVLVRPEDLTAFIEARLEPRVGTGQAA